MFFLFGHVVAFSSEKAGIHENEQPYNLCYTRRQAGYVSLICVCFIQVIDSPPKKCFSLPILMLGCFI